MEREEVQVTGRGTEHMTRGSLVKIKEDVCVGRRRGGGRREGGERDREMEGGRELRGRETDHVRR